MDQMRKYLDREGVTTALRIAGWTWPALSVVLYMFLIDDTWTTGGHAQSAAYALREAGASNVALVVIGRHLQPDWEVTDGVTSGDLFDELPTPFDWTICAAE